jgi:heat-inducible transcriptional repressor
MNPDASPSPELTKRQEELLALIVRLYTQKQEPVSSKFLAENSGLGLSSATIRNEMAVLEDLGFIASPHTSAGRVPTERGYRYFVRHLTADSLLTMAEQSQIAHRFQSLPMVTEQWMRFAASALARTAQTASLVTPPTPSTGRFKHMELISIQGRLALLVLVLQGGTVHQRMLNLADPVPQENLSAAANRLNLLCLDLTANEMMLKRGQLNLLEQEVLEIAAELVENSGSGQVRTIYREGLSEMMTALSDKENAPLLASQAVRVLEEHAFLHILLEEYLTQQSGDVQVIIAGEGRRDDINQLSMVLSRYGVPGKLSGAIGVIGPTHLNYGRAISGVQYVSSMMTNMLVKLYNDNGDEDETIISGQ